MLGPGGVQTHKTGLFYGDPVGISLDFPGKARKIGRLHWQPRRVCAVEEAAAAMYSA